MFCFVFFFKKCLFRISAHLKSVACFLMLVVGMSYLNILIVTLYQIILNIFPFIDCLFHLSHFFISKSWVLHSMSLLSFLFFVFRDRAKKHIYCYNLCQRVIYSVFSRVLWFQSQGIEEFNHFDIIVDGDREWLDYSLLTEIIFHSFPSTTY